MAAQESWKSNDSNSNILTIQISMIISSMLSIFYPEEPHIMTKILAAFRDVMSLSPKLFPSFPLQIAFNVFLFIPLAIIIGLKSYRNGLQSESPKVEQTLSLFKKILNVLTIPIHLHTGSALGALLTSIPNSVAIAASAILVHIIWNYTILILEYPTGFGHDFNIMIVWLIENTPVIVFTLYSLIFYAFQQSVGVYVCTICTILLSSFFVYLILGTSLFSGRRHNAVATIAGFATFIFTNLLQYLVPSKTVYWLTFAYISMNVIAIFGEWKLPTPINKKTRKINKGNMQTYDDGPNDGEKKSLRKFISLEKQDIATLGVFVFGILFMTFFNAMAARQMPIGTPLPDFIHNIFQTRNQKFQDIFRNAVFKPSLRRLHCISCHIMLHLPRCRQR
ncbi:hypothetical protein TVAG_402100 [Trichomonas vaginalis G3]|uniref:Uncharacterized protein n=1 Tax=Trichomonas vaginalis (strain ATCC PRA-98 / G3) TaxID=412133 RepID=A2DHW7_TRIV3|nr:hypothetical protein TVAGG3_0271610 [Trichomonas vaginalis G3]EAY19956.1 hypothetical protein TVAG_402100 [Trichomonas vaginalis G3]KAI5525906.1 hypothetical protein TVAGG3_0271610 [Trichomonas vaginalis G3]|eukprot:XP_001580942.1 hypothetical protein [Trichomonas vaginalis G3]